MHSPLAVGLIGCGTWGRHILRDLVGLGAEVDVVVRSDKSKARASEGGARSIIESVELLTDPDGIVVAVPTSVHAEVLDEVSELGVPIYVEKPLTNDPETAQRFKDRKDLFVMDKWRYHPGVEMLRDIVSDQRFGALRGMQTVRHGLYNGHSDVDALWILVPHDLSIVLEVTGRIPEPVAATGHVVAGGEASLLGILDGGISIDISSRSNHYRREVRVWFEDAVVALADGYSDALEVRRTHAGHEPSPERIPIGSRLPLEAELEAFLGHLRGGPPPRSSAADGVLNVERVQRLRDLAEV